jgi:hypothetical protein
MVILKPEETTTRIIGYTDDNGIIIIKELKQGAYNTNFIIYSPKLVIEMLLILKHLQK